jgi:hypothetical protein
LSESRQEWYLVQDYIRSDTNCHVYRGIEIARVDSYALRLNSGHLIWADKRLGRNSRLSLLPAKERRPARLRELRGAFHLVPSEVGSWLSFFSASPSRLWVSSVERTPAVVFLVDPGFVDRLPGSFPVVA